jgi:hypothetical protein
MVLMKLIYAFIAASFVGASRPLASSRNLSNDEVTERIGTYKMLAVRVTTAFGQEPQESLEDIEGSVFGTGQNAVVNSVVRQFDAVSHGQLRYIPAVTSGTVEIKMDQEIHFYLDTEQEMINATEALFGGAQLSTVADRILFCLPDDTLGGESRKVFSVNKKTYGCVTRGSVGVSAISWSSKLSDPIQFRQTYFLRLRS